MNDEIKHRPDTEPNLADPLIGCRLADKFLVEALLGSGGMSVVYRGLHESLRRAVAIKTLKLDLCSQPVIVSRFEREIKSLSRLNHSNIITVYDCVISPQGQPYIIMDYVEGESLETLLAKGPISISRALKLAVQICNGLEHAHRHGVIHRDIKPANIMLQSGSGGSSEVKIVDFGLAKLAEDTQKLTQSDELWGSLPYMSPEQCSSNANVEIDERSDIYSLGAVLFQMLTGKDPFYGLDLLSTINHHLTVPPPSFADVAPTLTIPAELEKVVRRALMKNPDDRFQSMRDFRDAIKFAAGDLLKDDDATESNTALNKAAAPRKLSQNRPQPVHLRAGVGAKSKSHPQTKLKLVTAGVTLICTIALAYCMLALTRKNVEVLHETVHASAASTHPSDAVVHSSATSHPPDVVHASAASTHPSDAVVHPSGTVSHSSQTVAKKPHAEIPQLRSGPNKMHTAKLPSTNSPRTPISLMHHKIEHPEVLKPLPKTASEAGRPSVWDSLNAERSH